MSENTPLDERMKRYEHATRVYLPRRTYTLMRLDGRAFHTYLRGAEKPFDHRFMEDMDRVAMRLVEEIQGAKLAYVQSDEISLLLADFEDLRSEPWFGGNLHKMISVSAGLASSYLGQLRHFHIGTPHFDCRVWTMTDPVEVANYFIWRQRDAVRNSIQMVGQTYFSHKQLDRKSVNDIQEMLFKEWEVNWNDFPVGCKRGRLIFDIPDEGVAPIGAPHFKAEPGNILADLIPPLPTLK